MVAVWLMVIGLDEYLAFVFFRWICGDVQIVAGGIFAVVNHLASDAVQRAVVEVESFLGKAVFQTIESVVVQVVSDTQYIRGIAILNFAVGQAGQKLIGASYLSGRLRTEYDIALFIQFKWINHADLAVTRLFALQYLHSFKKIQCLIKLIVALGPEFSRCKFRRIFFGIGRRERVLACVA